jgi:hypothetical protein
MTKIEELETDLAIHEKSLTALRDPNYNAKAYKGRIYRPIYDLNPNVIIPSYVKIIKSIKDELATLKGKSKKGKTK